MAVNPESKVHTWTPMIRTSDMRYPVYLSDFLQENKNISIGSFVWEADMRTSNYFMVHDVEIPVGEVVVEGKPAYNKKDELWYKTWEARDFTKEEVAANLSNQKENARQQAYNIFSSDLATGVVADGNSFVVEPRELANLQSTLFSASRAKPTDKFLIRKADYSVLELSAPESEALIGKIFQAHGKVHQSLLSFIKSVHEASDKDSVPEVPASFLEI